MNTDNVKEAAVLLTKAMQLLQRGPLDFYLKEISGAIEYCKEHYSPFRIGDEVILCSTPEINENHGWTSCKHFLVKGARAIVQEVDLGSKGFTYKVIFEDESWINRDKEVVKTEDGHRHTFGFSERYLVKA